MWGLVRVGLGTYGVGYVWRRERVEFGTCGVGYVWVRVRVGYGRLTSPGYEVKATHNKGGAFG